MVLTLQKPLVTVASERAPGGAPPSQYNPEFNAPIVALLAGLRCLWVSGHGGVLRSYPLRMYARTGDDLNGIVEAIVPGAVRRKFGGYPAICYPATANTSLQSTFVLPPSYTVYAVMSSLSVAFGIVGIGAVVGNTFSLYASAGALGFDHHSSDAANRMAAASNLKVDGTPNVCWAAFKGSTLAASMAGMNTGTGAARIAAASTETWTLPPVTTPVRIGKSQGSASVGQVYDVIIVPACWPADDGVSHTAMVTALAAKYGMTAA